MGCWGHGLGQANPGWMATEADVRHQGPWGGGPLDAKTTTMDFCPSELATLEMVWAADLARLGSQKTF